ncbi:hypothetical protein BVG16_25060 [Paenibacillus selenitireducens]|uniref:SLH domain-containing protein n=1 Tax=Paenibacillus selenitireducens TaxID=1324314 RepID=A0A1T2X2B1_9BACL|nr:S-layer homology domain-containing protein [Paenibacillus selenitireducens]OPA74031.1 hypothetical protein BVG16_25060 [Paenibacillus selenitireducens]
MKKKFIALCTAASLFSATPAFAASVLDDIDSQKYGWALDSISFMLDKEVIGGYPDGTFKPSNPVTKAEFAHMYRLLFPNVDHSSNEPSYYIDTKKHWAAKDVTTLFNDDVYLYAERVKYINLPKNDYRYDFYFAPDKQMTRVQFLIYLYALTSALHPADEPDTQEVINHIRTYKDVKARTVQRSDFDTEYTLNSPVFFIDEYEGELTYGGDFQDTKALAFYTLTKAGIMDGADGYFRPMDKVTRAEAATILHRLFKTMSVEG